MPAISPKINQKEGLTLVNSGELYRDQLIIMLEHVQMFADFPALELNTLANYLHAYQAEIDTVLFSEGERTSHMCLLIEGRLDVFKEISAGKRKKLAEIRPGKSIGEMSVIDGLPTSATVIVSQPSVLVLMTRDDLERIADSHPQLGFKLIWHFANLLSQRLRYTSGRLIDRL